MSNYTKKELEDKIRSLEATIRIYQIKEEALENALHQEIRTFWSRAISVAEQY
tara:strand:+ start:263 stop:421 length:159 start_codon:yes stop_codon:yes gene_type:complete